jgi:uncharacterized protein (DUF2235 family)
MSKRIVICADGTWNRPEKDSGKEFPTNVLRLARAIKPVDKDGISQQVFYDWGVGSNGQRMISGISGKGLQKNIMDGYRYIVQNYSPGDEIFLFGFSRGAYTMRSLCGMINNCGILKRRHANLIENTFELYKRSGRANKPTGGNSLAFRQAHAHPDNSVRFVGAWDTVGSMGIPISFLGLLDDRDEFHDTEIGSCVKVARHAMAIDEHRSDFAPTIWDRNANTDLVQAWFAGAHSNIGGSYKPDRDGGLLSDNALDWMIREAEKCGLAIENHLPRSIKKSATATLHNSRRSFYRVKKKHYRQLGHNKGQVFFHRSVKQRWDNDKSYRPRNLLEYIDQFGWPKLL